MPRLFEISRRELFQAAGLALPPVAGPLHAAPLAAAPDLDALNRFPRMVQEYYVGRVRRAEQTSLKIKNALKTKADAEAYVETVRKKLRRCFGPFPEKTPLNARIAGVVERDSYRLEKVIFESRPGFLVTANLYVPKGRKLPAPGVVGCCGHSANGKAAVPYQSFPQALARMGYVALVFDPIGQGERWQYLAPGLKPRMPGNTVGEHLQAGNQQLLVGEVFAGWRAWDGIRALDYLLSRPEVDPKHVGVTGTSGGGTMSTWLCALERRWTMAAPSCFITTFRRNMENELPADSEQYPTGALALGLDHDDFLAAMAPKPVAILANERDYFDIRGAEEVLRRLKKLYGLLGAEQNVALLTAPTHHGFSKENRENLYRWFNRHTGISDVRSEPELTIEKDETLWCTPRGQVAGIGSRPIFSFTAAKAKAMDARRPALQGEALKRAVVEVLRLPPRSGSPDARILRHVRPRRYPKPEFVTYAVETEPGILAIVYRLYDEVHYSRPPAGVKRAVLYVSHLSADAELRREPLLRELVEAEPQAAIYACDVRGIGESRPNTCGADAYSPYGADYFYSGYGLMLNAPYAGQRTHDVLRVVDWLGACGHAEVHLAAKGWGTIPATLAALLAPRVVQVTLRNAPVSYSEIARTEAYDWPLAAMPPGVLSRFDLPDCYRALQAKQLRQIDPAGAGPVPA